jgi:hypothetical protein
VNEQRRQNGRCGQYRLGHGVTPETSAAETFDCEICPTVRKLGRCPFELIKIRAQHKLPSTLQVRAQRETRRTPFFGEKPATR